MRLAALALFGPVLFAQSSRGAVVTAVRTWPMAEATRVAVEVSGPFEFKYDRLHNPDRVYFDIKGAHPLIDGKRIWSRHVTDQLVQRIRVAETAPEVTRVVLDVTGPVEVSPSILTAPYRLMIELRREVSSAPVSPATSSASAAQPEVPGRTELAKTEPGRPAPPAPEPVKAEPPVRDTSRLSSASQQAAGTEIAKAAEPEKAAPRHDASRSSSVKKQAAQTEIAGTEGSKPAVPLREPANAGPAELETPPPPVKSDAPAATVPAEVPAAKEEAPATAAELAKGARHSSSGGNSLTRALGLKLNRIVLDAGHGGHDQGTTGPKGLLEKDLVLDVTLRLGKLIQEGLGAEVIYTRSDDTFIPLEGRTAIANQKKADLFLSIHANSSPLPRITGVETYYLNFTDSREAMDLAARENAASQRSIFELQDLLHKITLHEKIDESREFATRVQSALYALSARNFPGQKNRGVKKAPFVVLIGAQMPSILAEIGFVTNPREEQLLKRSDYRQKIAESLYKGVSKYAESLSHFQLARNQ